MSQVLVMDSCCSIVNSNEIAEVDDTAANASTEGIANGSTVFAEAHGTTVLDGIAAEVDVSGAVDVAAKTSGTAVACDATAEADGIQVVFLSLSSIHSLWLLLSLSLSISLFKA